MDIKAKLAYTGMRILDLIKILMYEFHYDYININIATTRYYYLQTLIVYYMKLKQKMSMKILAVIKKCLILVIIQAS